MFSESFVCSVHLSVGLLPGFVVYSLFFFVYVFNIDSQNKANLESIEKSMFVLCLDESPLQHPSDQEKSLADPDYTVTSREMLHGGGIASNSGNRWFDKIFQVISLGNFTCFVYLRFTCYNFLQSFCS